MGDFVGIAQGQSPFALREEAELLVQLHGGDGPGGQG